MSYGLQIRNGLNEVVVDDRHFSMVRVQTGFAGAYRFKSGDACQAYNSSGKGADLYSTTFPYTDEVYGGTRRTLYHYRVDSVTFPTITKAITLFSMNVGDQMSFGRVARKTANGSPNSGQIFTYIGINTTNPSLKWATIDTRNPDLMPTGYGMAIYGEDGKCRWSADDEVAVITAAASAFDTSQLNIWGGDCGYIRSDYISGWAFDGPGATTLYGHYLKTATNELRWIPDAYQATLGSAYYGNFMMATLGS